MNLRSLFVKLDLSWWLRDLNIKVWLVKLKEGWDSNFEVTVFWLKVSKNMINRCKNWHHIAFHLWRDLGIAAYHNSYISLFYDLICWSLHIRMRYLSECLKLEQQLCLLSWSKNGSVCWSNKVVGGWFSHLPLFYPVLKLVRRIDHWDLLSL